ncbi:MAG: hypothetical protein K2M91_07385 [Lachnospiraceae bacterium]|nr:hypothetical protein [Lachnospiraceae bacterium]
MFSTGVKLILFLILFPICSAFYAYLILSISQKQYNPYDPEKKRFGHKPRMKYITKLTCGQVIARLWMDSYGPFDCQFGKEEDTYTFTINRMVCYGSVYGRAKYKVIIMPEQEWSAVYFYIIDYRATQYALNVFAWELKGYLEKKLEAVRVE